MAYGLQVTTGSTGDILQIDSTTEMRVLCPQKSGTASSFTTGSGDYVFVKITPNSGDYKCIIAWTSTDGNTYFNVGTNQILNVYSTTTASVSYIITNPIYNLSSPTGNYGLQVYRDSDGALAFDSRYFNAQTTFALTNIFINGSRTGNVFFDAKLTTSLTDSNGNPYYSYIRPYASFNTSPPSPAIMYGAVFSNNHSTLGTGIYYYGIYSSLGGGTVYNMQNTDGNYIGVGVS